MSIFCLGDSNTYGYDPRSFWGDRYDSSHRWVDLLSKKTNKSVINGGVNGLQIPRGPIELPQDCDFLVLMLGTNDLLQGADADAAANRMARFLETLPQTLPVLLIAPPTLQKGAWVCDEALIDASLLLAERYRAISSEKCIRFTDSATWGIPLAFDGVHFAEEGHVLFAEHLTALLRELI